MEKVEIDILTRYGWECLFCGQWHETSEDPRFMGTVACEDCGEEFEPLVDELI